VQSILLPSLNVSVDMRAVLPSSRRRRSSLLGLHADVERVWHRIRGRQHGAANRQQPGVQRDNPTMGHNQTVAWAASSTLDSPPSTTPFALTASCARRTPRTTPISTSSLAVSMERSCLRDNSSSSHCSWLSLYFAISVGFISTKVQARAFVGNCTFGAEYKCMTLRRSEGKTVG
jgi:hypothetical protein